MSKWLSVTNGWIPTEGKHGKFCHENGKFNACEISQTRSDPNDKLARP